MSPEVRAAIEARLERCQRGMGVVPAGDVADLLAELERLEGDRERLRAALTDLLRHGEHDGPCTNDDGYDSCDLHVAASEERAERARAALREVAP